MIGLAACRETEDPQALASIVHDDVLQALGAAVLGVDLTRRLHQRMRYEQALDELAGIVDALGIALDRAAGHGPLRLTHPAPLPTLAGIQSIKSRRRMIQMPGRDVWVTPARWIGGVSGSAPADRPKSRQNVLYFRHKVTGRRTVDEHQQSITYQTEWRVDTIPGGAMNQLALIPLDSLESADRQPGSRIISMPGRSGRAPRTAVGAPGYLSVRAASEQLGLRPRSVRYLIEHGRLTSQRLGRIHFIPQAQVDQYRRARRARARARQRSLA